MDCIEKRLEETLLSLCFEKNSSRCICKEYEKKFDDYNIIMTKAIADRLAEAFAEHLHERVRKEYWAYNRDETLNAEDLHKIKYQVGEILIVFCKIQIDFV